MNGKEIYEATQQEPQQEIGVTLRNHIIDILQPFKEMGQIEWATDSIISICDSELEEFRPSLHSEECMARMKDKVWACSCNFDGSGDSWGG